MRKLIYCVCRKRETVWEEAYKKKEEQNKSVSVRREVVEELAAKGMSKVEVREIVFGFGY
ncbi:hypothetical protein QTL97_12250 [Sporosarcina thermotolerans]|uniref:Uncharacterized protein n=1 Tax=Sporosarcina thermotolerans TaxID=633404 RepID=A0AAW9A943_9BACL|nr:hypothetical protein [Sporosarcina thermotolerans]MDW0117712.1 hypothetical protein [Sporosarcina thermotolerans]WHT49197.1 hypothetical protein QNH10_06125 [Sporosarcina thermotolerans]